MKPIRLSPEYECWPTWVHDGEIYDNVDPASLPPSEDLAQAILAWDERYPATYCPDDPPSSGFSSPQEQHDYRKEGDGLFVRLEAALGRGAPVEYRVLRDLVSMEDHRQPLRLT